MAAWGTADWRRIAAALVVAVIPQIAAAMAAKAIVDRARAEAERLRAVAVAATEDAHSAERAFVGQVHGMEEHAAACRRAPGEGRGHRGVR